MSVDPPARYDPVDFGGLCVMEPTTDGEWIRTEHYDALALRVAALEAEVDRLRAVILNPLNVGPDDPAACPAGHADQCCGYRSPGLPKGDSGPASFV